jgi:hypothetical protein
VPFFTAALLAGGLLLTAAIEACGCVGDKAAVAERLAQVGLYAAAVGRAVLRRGGSVLKQRAATVC